MCYVCVCVLCPVYMSKTGTWFFLVSGKEIWDFLKLILKELKQTKNKKYTVYSLPVFHMCLHDTTL
jgi:hypothetical protein